MKTVLMAPLPPPIGGIASWANSLLHSKFPDDWELLLVDEKILGTREVYGENIRFHFGYEVKRTFGIWRSLWRTLSDKEALVVHANTSATVTGMFREIVSAGITHLRGRKFLIEYHCTLPNELQTWGKRFFFRLLSWVSDGLIVLNQASADYAAGRTQRTIHLIPNFIESQYVSSQRNIAPKVRTVLYTGGVSKDKGCLDMIEAAKAYPDIEFILMGRVAPEIESAERPSNVTLTGCLEREQVMEALREADLFLFCSRMSSEGFSVSLTEAMAAGLPCIVTDWAANRDMVEGKGGLVIPICDPDALKAALGKLIASPELRKEMSAFNIQKVRENYIDTIILKKYADAYAAAVGEKN